MKKWIFVPTVLFFCMITSLNVNVRAEGNYFDQIASEYNLKFEGDTVYMEEESALYYLEFKLGKPVEESVIIDLFGQRAGNGRVFFTPRQMAWLYYEAIPDDQKKNFLKKVENQAIEIQQKNDMILISYTGNFIE